MLVLTGASLKWSQCQAQPRRVTFDATNPAASGTLPFDQYFTLTIKNIGAGTEALPVTVNLYELPRGPKSYLNAADQITDITILASLPRFSYAGLTVVADSVSVPVLVLLSPNREYFLEVTKFRKLTTNEAAALSTYLNAQPTGMIDDASTTLVSDQLAREGVKSKTFNGYINALVERFISRRAADVVAKGYTLVTSDAVSLVPATPLAASQAAMKKWNTDVLNILNQVGFTDPATGIITPLGETRGATAMEVLLRTGPTTRPALDALRRANPTVFDTSVAITDALKDAVLMSLGSVKTSLHDLQDAIVSAALASASYVALASSYGLNTKENAKLHYSMNFGGLYDGRGDKFRTFTTLNFFFRPIDPSLPLDVYTHSVGQWFAARGSLCLGLSDNTIADPGTGKRGLVGDRALMLGAGLRFLWLVTLNAGTLIYEQDDPNPLVKSYATKFSPYIGFSANLELKSIFGLK